MRKRSLVLIVALVLAALLCGCGEETFMCAVCQETVTQKPNEVTKYGQTIRVCGDCYQYLQYLE